MLKCEPLRDPLSELRREFKQYCLENGYPDGQITRNYVRDFVWKSGPASDREDLDARHLFWTAHRDVGPAITFSYTEALMFRQREMRALIRFLDVNGHEGDDERAAGSFLIRRGGSYVARILTPGTKGEALSELADSAPAKRSG